MTSNEQLIHHFYSSFQRKDVQAMQDCYAEDATFTDSVFTNLNTAEVRSMWAMLLKGGKDMRIEFKNIITDETGTHAEWNAWYTFSATRNRVHNRINASFIIENDKIIKHTDHFSFYKWAKQALGFTGLLLGWTSFIKNKIKTKARKNLEAFMASSN